MTVHHRPSMDEISLTNSLQVWVEIVKISQMAIKELLKVQSSKTRQSILSSVIKPITKSSNPDSKCSKTIRTVLKTSKPWSLTLANTRKSTEVIARS